MYSHFSIIDHVLPLLSHPDSCPVRISSKFWSRNDFLLDKMLVLTSNLSWFLILHFNPLILIWEPLLGYCVSQGHVRDSSQGLGYLVSQGHVWDSGKLIMATGVTSLRYVPQWLPSERSCATSCLDVDFHKSYSCSCKALGHGAVPAVDIPDPCHGLLFRCHPYASHWFPVID